MKIQLREQMFSDKEQLFLDDGELKAYLFRYDSGVCGEYFCGISFHISYFNNY